MSDEVSNLLQEFEFSEVDMAEWETERLFLLPQLIYSMKKFLKLI